MNRPPIQPSSGVSQVKGALARLNASPEFASSDRLRGLLGFLIEQTLEGRQEELKETVIGVEAFGRDPGYDPKVDGVVRSEARRLRLKLAEYYSGSGRDEPLVIALPKGGYVPEFQLRESPPAASEDKAPKRAPVARGRSWRYWAAAAILGAAVVGYSISRARLQPPPARVPRLLDLGLSFNGAIVRAPVFSSDGGSLLFSMDNGGRSHIWIHDLRSHANRQITTGDVRDYMPCWSPDGGKIAFVRRSRMDAHDLVIQDLDSGRARTLGRVARVLPIEWSRDGRFLAVSDESSPGASLAIFLINVETGARRQITFPPGSMQDVEPRFSRSGKKLAFVRSLGEFVNDIYLQPLKQSLDPEGQPVRLTTDKQAVKGFAWSAEDQSVIASMKRGKLTRSLWRIPLDGSQPEYLPESGIEPLNPTISPKTAQIAYLNLIQDTNIWRVGHDDGPFIESNRGDTAPQISPDDQWIVFRSKRSGSDGIWLAKRDGTGARELSDCGGYSCGDARWSPDSEDVAFDSAQAGSPDIYIMSIHQANAIRYTTEPGNEINPSWSHDGKHIYYASDRSGAWQIWRRPVEGGTAEQITRDGGYAGTEDSTGSYLYFSRQRGEKGIWRIPLTGGPAELVIPNVDSAMWGSWAVAAKGIYFIDYDPVTAGGPGLIEFFDLPSQTRRPVAKTGRMPVMWDLSLGVAPNGSDVLYSQLDRGGTEIFLLDRFH